MPPDGYAVHVNVSPEYPEAGATLQYALNVGLDTEIAVHAPELLLSLDSLMAPESAVPLLSAQTRKYQIPPEGNAYESPATSVPFADTLGEPSVPISVVFAPPADVARWNKLVKAPFVPDCPMLVIVAENICATPATAEVGDTAPVMRSDNVTLTATEFEHVTVAEFPPEVIATEPVLIPLPEYVFETELAVPERLSVPLHTYVYEPVPPEGTAVHVAELPAYILVGVTEQEPPTGTLPTVSALEQLITSELPPEVIVIEAVFAPELE